MFLNQVYTPTVATWSRKRRTKTRNRFRATEAKDYRWLELKIARKRDVQEKLNFRNS